VKFEIRCPLFGLILSLRYPLQVDCVYVHGT
jgi:hypothetical protein